MDRQTDGRTDTTSYRDAMAHLKKSQLPVLNQCLYTSVAKGVTEKLKQKGFDLSKIFFICGDSTASNTGYGSGAFSWFEEFGMKAYHWVLCVSHLIELPLR